MTEKAKKRPDVEFVDVLMRQGRGATNQELSDNLREITKRVSDTGKPGTLTLTLTIRSIKKTGQILIEDKIKTKLPEYDRPAGIAFADDDGNLLREDPNQMSLFEEITEVEDGGNTVVVDLGEEGKKVVDLTTGEIKE